MDSLLPARMNSPGTDILGKSFKASKTVSCLPRLCLPACITGQKLSVCVSVCLLTRVTTDHNSRRPVYNTACTDLTMKSGYKPKTRSV